jgi:hypothetical protein
MIAVSFDAVIFDFDGLIIDSETPIFRIWEEIYRDHGAELTMGAWQHALGTHNGFDPYAELAAMTGTRLSREEWAPRVSEEHWRRCESEPLLPGVADRLAEARALGIRTAVASSSTSTWVTPWLERHGLRGSFDAVCTRDDVKAVKAGAGPVPAGGATDGRRCRPLAWYSKTRPTGCGPPCGRDVGSGRPQRADRTAADAVAPPSCSRRWPTLRWPRSGNGCL